MNHRTHPPFAPRIDGPTARQLVKQGAVLLDVRTPMEAGQGSLPGARNLPLQRLPLLVTQLDPHATYIVFCRSGNRSAAAGRILLEHGLQRVHDLGSVGAW